MIKYKRIYNITKLKTKNKIMLKIRKNWKNNKTNNKITNSSYKITKITIHITKIIIEITKYVKKNQKKR